MGFGNNINGDEFVASNYGSRFKNIDQIIAFDKNKLEVYRSLIIELSRQLNKTIVLRPHPEENHSFYLNAFNNIDNVHVIYEGSVVPWILAADLMIHPDCTTAIESLLLGKRPLSYLPKDYHLDYVTSLPLKASSCFVSENELIKYINNKEMSNGNVDLENFPFINNYFSYSKSTTQLIADNINSLINCYTKSNTFGLSLKIMTFLKYKSIKLKLSNLFIEKLSRNKIQGFSSKNLFDINKWIISENENFESVKCVKLATNLYLYRPID